MSDVAFDQGSRIGMHVKHTGSNAAEGFFSIW